MDVGGRCRCNGLYCSCPVCVCVRVFVCLFIVFCHHAHLDIVFNPLAPSNQSQTPAATFRKHELEKKRAYQQRVQDIEHSSFTPLVLSVTGGMGVEATTFYKRLAALLSQKWDSPYSKTLCWLRCRLSFSLIRSALQAIRGARSSQGRAAHLPTSVDLITTEARISPQ